MVSRVVRQRESPQLGYPTKTLAEPVNRRIAEPSKHTCRLARREKAQRVAGTTMMRFVTKESKTRIGSEDGLNIQPANRPVAC
jgi:hypothetical protein